MGGEISVESKPGQGSTFSFTATFRRTKGKEERVLVLPREMEHFRALVVEGNLISRRILKDILKSFNIKVSLAASGEECIRVLEKSSDKNPFDLVLLDWKMPGIDGIQTAQKIKGHTGLKHIPKVIMITAIGYERIMENVDNNGLDYFLNKPVSASNLFDTIMDIFGFRNMKSLSQTIQKDNIIQSLSGIRGARILLVEDNEINQQLAQELLEGAGLIVNLAGNGREALKKISKKNYDAILMDIQMPVMDGYQACREIRQIKGLHTIPIIAMTAHALSGDREKCIEAGMNDHVSKPISPDFLFTALLKWIKPGKRAFTDPSDVPDTGKETEGIIFPDLPGISIKSGLARTQGDQSLYLGLLQKFYLNHSAAAEDITTAMNEGDRDTAIQLAHTIKGTAGNIGAEKLHLAAKDLETAFRKNQADKEKELLDYFSRTLKSVILSLSVLPEPDLEPGSGSVLKPGVEPKDFDLIFSLINRLKELLEDDSALSGQAFSDLKKALSHIPEIEGMIKLEKNILVYAFEDALKTLPGIKYKLKELSKGNFHAD